MPPEVQLLVIAVAFVGFWLIVMRPARNAQRRTQALQASLAVGDEVILTSGIFGRVTSLDNEKVGIELAPGVVVTVARQAVLRQATEVASAAEETSEPDEQSQGDQARGNEE